jgi:hypothetical protein
LSFFVAIININNNSNNSNNSNNKMSQGWKPRGIPTVLEVYGRQFLIWEDIDNKFFRACLAEFMAMHLFVLLW